MKVHWVICLIYLSCQRDGAFHNPIEHIIFQKTATSLIPKCAFQEVKKKYKQNTRCVSVHRMLWSSMFYYQEVSCESWETQTMTVISKAFIWQFIIWWMWRIPFQFCNFSWVFWKNAFLIGTSLSSLFKYVLVNGWSMSSFPFAIFSIHIWLNGHLSDIIFFFLSSPRWIKCFKQDYNIYGKDFCLFFSLPTLLFKMRKMSFPPWKKWG